jgi:hypothetical protein
MNPYFDVFKSEPVQVTVPPVAAPIYMIKTRMVRHGAAIQKIRPVLRKQPLVSV